LTLDMNGFKEVAISFIVVKRTRKKSHYY